MRITLNILFIFIALQVQAQQLTPAVIASGGQQTAVSNINLAYTIGQVFTPISQGTKVLTSGFNQPDLTVSDIQIKENPEISFTKENFRTYPNPASEFLIIEVPSELSLDNLDVEIWDVKGQRVDVSSENKTDENNLYFRIGNLPRSYYFFRLYRKDNNKPIATFRILKN